MIKPHISKNPTFSLDASLIEVDLNANTALERGGKDLYVAKTLERPGLKGFGATTSGATEDLRSLALSLWRVSTPGEKAQIKQNADVAAFKNALSNEEVVQISERAETAGCNLADFVLRQCLKAPYYLRS